MQLTAKQSHLLSKMKSKPLTLLFQTPLDHLRPLTGDYLFAQLLNNCTPTFDLPTEVPMSVFNQALAELLMCQPITEAVPNPDDAPFFGPPGLQTRRRRPCLQYHTDGTYISVQDAHAWIGECTFDTAAVYSSAYPPYVRIKEPSLSIKGHIAGPMYPSVDLETRPRIDYYKLTKERHEQFDWPNPHCSFSKLYRILVLSDAVFPTPSVGREQEKIDFMFNLLASPFGSSTRSLVIHHQVIAEITERNFIPFKISPKSPQEGERPTKKLKTEPFKQLEFSFVCEYILTKDYELNEGCISDYIPWTMICKYMIPDMFFAATKNWLQPLHILLFSYLLEYNFWNKLELHNYVMPFVGTIDCYSFFEPRKPIFAIDLQVIERERQNIADFALFSPDVSEEDE